MKIAKLIISILSIVAFVVVFLETFFPGIVSVLASLLPALSPLAGIPVAAVFLIGGLVGLFAANNSLLGIIGCVLFLLSAVYGFLFLILGDPSLLIWACVSAVFGLFCLYELLFIKNGKIAAKA